MPIRIFKILSEEELLKKKNIALDIFKPGDIQLESPIEKHTEWAYTNIYSVPYPGESKNVIANRYGIARYVHGIQHVTRVAFYIPVLANLYRRYMKLDSLTKQDIKLLQIAAIFHDAAREGEGKDLWDTESACLYYYYLTKVLNVDSAKAIRYAEIIANKDFDQEYIKLIAEPAEDKSIFVIDEHLLLMIYLLHDADCLDIIRARAEFNAASLRFYQKIAKNNKIAFEEMAKLIINIKRLIHKTGDSFCRTNAYTKIDYENDEAYRCLIDIINQRDFNIIHYLYNDGKFISDLNPVKKLISEHKYDPFLGFTAENLRAALNAGMVFVRAIALPSALRLKEGKRHPNETNISVELRKSSRRPDVPTDAGNTNRYGNPKRAVSVLPSGMFAPAGLAKFNIELKNITEIAAADIGSGRFKKLSHGFKKISTDEEKRSKLNDLLYQQKMGGKAVTFDLPWYHNEITCLLTEEYDAVIYTEDETLMEYVVNTTKTDLFRYYSAFLQAIYIQNEYFNKFGKRLPILQYSQINDYLYLDESWRDHEKIKDAWVSMCLSYVNKKINERFLYIYNMKIEDIKIYSMYGAKEFHITRGINAADDNYDAKTYGENFIANINETIIKAKEEAFAKQKLMAFKKITRDKYAFSILRESVFWQLIVSDFLTNPDLLGAYQKLVSSLEIDEKFFIEFPDTSKSYTNVEIGLIRESLAFKDVNYYSLYYIVENEEYAFLFKLYLLAKKIDVDFAIDLKNRAKLFCEKYINNIESSENAMNDIIFLIKFSYIFDLYEIYKERISNLLFILAKPKEFLLAKDVWDAYENSVHKIKMLGLMNPAISAEIERLLQHYLNFISEEENAVYKKILDLGTFLFLAKEARIDLSARLKTLVDILKIQYLHFSNENRNKIRLNLREDSDNKERFQMLVSAVASEMGANLRYGLFFGNAQGHFNDWQFEILIRTLLKPQLAEYKNTSYKELVKKYPFELIKGNGLQIILYDSVDKLYPILTSILESKDENGPDYLCDALLKNDARSLNIVLTNGSFMMLIIQYLMQSEKGCQYIAVLSKQKEILRVGWGIASELAIVRIYQNFRDIFNDVITSIASLKNGDEHLAQIISLTNLSNRTILDEIAKSNDADSFLKLMDISKHASKLIGASEKLKDFYETICLQNKSSKFIVEASLPSVSGLFSESSKFIEAKKEEVNEKYLQVSIQ